MRSILAAFALLLGLSGGSPDTPAARVEVSGPDGRLQVVVTVPSSRASPAAPGSGSPARLTYHLSVVGRPVLSASSAGIVIDGVDVGLDAVLGQVERSRCESGSSSERPRASTPPCRVARLHLAHGRPSIDYVMEVRVFDAGMAFRYEVPGSAPRTPDEATTFQIPPGSTVWYHDLEGHYEGVHVRRAIDEVPARDWAAPPLTFKLPGNAGYAAITEAALIGYAGMALQADGRRGFAARLGHDQPVNKPYALRFPPEEATRLAVAAPVDPPIVTPWRVVLTGRDLNGLVNAGRLVTDLSPPPDPQVWPEGPRPSWIKPGRAVWRYLDGGDNTIEGMKQFSDLAARLGFEYQVVEGVWQKWSPEDLRAFIDYSRSRGVGIWLWKDSRAIRDAEARRQFFDLCQSLGVVGTKVDFLDHEAKEVIDYYRTILRDAASRHVMVAFHGANKPTGEARTWPNELTREGVFGLEHRSMQAWARHNTTLPFTRYLAGPGDYTPVVFGERRRETSWAHQVATAAVFTSPLLVYGGHPQSLLDSPAVEMIKSIPSVWDETIVLPPSEIGEVAVLARRRGQTWFLAILNGPEARTLRLTPAFLPAGRHDTFTVSDVPENPAAVAVAHGTVSRTEALTIALRPGGGFIARFAFQRQVRVQARRRSYDWQ
jgi:alpha-glucosidase